MFPTFMLALRILTSPTITPMAVGCPVTVTSIAHGYATLAIPECDGEAPYTVRARLRNIPKCARVVGGWLACESIGWVPKQHCYPYTDGQGEWCPEGG